jgi:hypothetical protein
LGENRRGFEIEVAAAIPADVLTVATDCTRFVTRRAASTPRGVVKL